MVRELAADGIPVATACRVLDVSTSGFYEWGTRPASDRDWEQAHLMDAIREAHKALTAPTAIAGSTPSWCSASTCRSVMVVSND